MGLDAGLNGHEAQSYDFSVDFPERLRRLGQEIGLSSVGIGRRQTALAESASCWRTSRPGPIRSEADWTMCPSSSAGTSSSCCLTR